jgi:hypothetical protein
MIIHHGSEDSIDKDVYVVIPSPILDIQECKVMCESYTGLNANLICIENGQVTWCYKGTVDECNNSILSTYTLHPENTQPCPVTVKAERNWRLKVDRTVRGLLTYFSRTEHRVAIKAALRSEDMREKLEALKLIRLQAIPNFGKKGENKDVYKFIAFQLAQTIALVEDGHEIFTKQMAAKYDFELRPYLYREVFDPKDTQYLNDMLELFIFIVYIYYF